MKKRGFTLIELMIVVAIIGVLAAIAIPSFLRFVKKSKTAEAATSLFAVRSGAISWFNTEHNDTDGNPLEQHFPSYRSPNQVATMDTSTLNPSDNPCIDATISRGALYAKNTQRWNAYPWLALKFSLTKAHYYRYEYRQSGILNTAKFGISAWGDLDCDKTYSKFGIDGSVDATSGEVEVTEIRELLPLE